jgi:uncharacterized membrane protein YdbT with pleckstrin-like domain
MADVFVSEPRKKEKNIPFRLIFETQEEEEKVVLFLRQHPIVNLSWGILAVLMVLAPLVLGYFPFLSFLPGNFQLVAILIWYLITSAFVLEKFLSWYFNIYIVTNKRVVDIDFYNLVYKEVSDADIDKVQDVTYTMGGVVRTLFNYGDVLIQTAAEKTEFEFEAVSNPDEVAKTIQSLGNKEEVAKYGEK